MSFTRRSIRINNENEMPADLASSRPGKRQILRDAQDAGNPEKRPRFMKSQSSTTTGGPRRTALGDVTNRRSALGDVTNRINIKKASVSSMSSSVTNAGALAKKKVIASKRSLSNINIGSRTLNTANASKRNLSNVNLISRHVSSMTSSTSSLSSRSSSSIISRMSRPLPSTTNTLGSLGLQDKISPSVNIIPPTPEENEHDIDSEDRNDPTACWQYAEDITKYHLETEYEEIYPPEAEDFVKITDNAYTREEVFQMEAKMLATIGYRVTFPTAYQFMKRFIKASRTCDDRVEHFAHYVVDRSLQEYKLMKFLPSTIAASAVYIARTQMRDTPAWLKEMIWNAHNGVGKLHKLTAARRKFSKERFMAVAAGSLAFSKSA
ncbi:Serine/threonine protein phosphatase 2A 59 kDa regulatory subunit B' eta isoform [Phytophthora nicotianae]|uniref:Serine/threonine protein phosphatase 2A 59 kDa regulatory subunit B' eta isoform n=1 Tax=Phytophthora nicotianae TaxID=4792 RepID=A0A0W8DL77_PHYNI|nr:Serine/threonine protein phosphatase 2A 59 kDa regulatory subunit B' eta isoform [Phytophthora nicotianae]